MCEHPVVTLRPSPMPLPGYIATVYWFECLTCPVKASIPMLLKEPAA